MSESRWLDREEVASYISIRVDQIPRELKAGKLPKPSLHLGPRRPRWDKHLLDQLFRGSVPGADVDSIVEGLADDIRSGRFKGRHQNARGRQP